MTHEDAIAAILAREQEKGVVTEAELRQQLADVTNERDSAKKDRFAALIQLKASEARIQGLTEDRDSWRKSWNISDKSREQHLRSFLASEELVKRFCDIADERARGYASRMHGGVLNHECMDKVCALAESIAQSAPATDEQGAGHGQA